KSFENLSFWFSQAEKYANENVMLCLIANKIDSIDESYNGVDLIKKGQELAEKMGIAFYELSAKNADMGYGVMECFTDVAEKVLENNAIQEEELRKLDLEETKSFRSKKSGSNLTKDENINNCCS